MAAEVFRNVTEDGESSPRFGGVIFLPSLSRGSRNPNDREENGRAVLRRRKGDGCSVEAYVARIFPVLYDVCKNILS